MHTELTKTELAILDQAYTTLENPSWWVQLSSAAGMPVEAVTRQLRRKAPESVVNMVSQSTQRAIEFVMQSSIRSMQGQEQYPASPGLHKAAALTTGAVSGFFGLQTLVVELPLTTGIMFRSIADIARAEGESPQDPETVVNCMQVFAMGSRISAADDAAETSYYGVRVALGKAVTDALQYVASHGMGQAGAPALVRLVSAIAARFGIVVTQKAMAQTIPVLGAVGGGLVNTIFISHFQDMARGHFAIRRLERKYGAEVVKEAYLQLQGSAVLSEKTNID
ncbi:MAG: EcsC family protein [Gammaproteobacteria bacterium]